MKKNFKPNYNEKKVFLGVDVHKNSYSVTAICEKRVIKSWHMTACPEDLVSRVGYFFEGARVFSVYEAGFSGFHLHRILTEAGISNIVVNPASIEIAKNQKVKTDKKDSRMLAEKLAIGQLKGIYIPSLKEELRRLLSRTRAQLLKKKVRTSNQIKSKLFQFGYIKAFDKQKMSLKFIKLIQNLDLPFELKESISILINEWKWLCLELKKLLKRVKEKDSIKQRYLTVPGIGPVGAEVLSAELRDMKRFKNQKELFSYTGMTPTERSSGDGGDLKAKRKGHISRVGNSRVRAVLVEAAWIAIKRDEALRIAFDRIASTQGSKRAIVAIGRKLIGRMRACFIKNTIYQRGVCQ